MGRQGKCWTFFNGSDLERFLEHYLRDDLRELSPEILRLKEGKTRALGWNLEGDWLDHTGLWQEPSSCTIRKRQEAVIFCPTGPVEKDERAQWILDRNSLMDLDQTRM